MSETHDILTVRELAAYLRIPISTIYKLAQEGGLPGVKVGRHWRFHKDAVDTWLKRDPSPASSRRSGNGDQKEGE